MVFALTRNRAEELAAAGFRPIVGDVLDPESLKSLPKVDTVLYAIGLDRSAGRSMREVYVDGMKNVSAALPPVKRFIHISSTSVYGQTDGEWVTEDSPTEPLDDNGRIVLEVERTLRESIPSAVILRFAGITGSGRWLRQQALLAGDPYTGDAEKWLNLIHVDDGVRAVRGAEVGPPGSTFNIADGSPVTRREFYTEAARRLGAPEARFEPGPGKIREANRRIGIDSAKRGLGFQPQYPSFREGLSAMD